MAVKHKFSCNSLPAINKQNGAVLVVSLIFLISLTAVAAALMQNTTSDMKMSGASEEKLVATQEAVSAIDEVIYNQVAPGQTNQFAKPLVVANFPNTDQSLLLPGTKTGSTATVDIANNELRLEADCPHSRSASSVQVFTCNVLKVQVNRNYGRNNVNTVDVNSGVAQQLLK
ncbi:pilus assembly PilX N-terminal domain-containing protein [Colwellia sp. 1_MG-2023]|uniref:pilus assembly PilX family protein n=1 Tax=Colwellia sp. 1_MG-2023 TaxID=3062649 RepID=UPI0026E34D2E|nr:pilus assembly PilX N-terminal domain-containing protein [Colwellia sp. 1_MG-2023]MDO6445834.1 pilus assembly PilX N-terminal domain-containing protein [Colwellia sp. 1_MG-2023]